MLDGIHSLQDFVMLIKTVEERPEYAHVKRPSIIIGWTNAAMAKIAERVGFKVHNVAGQQGVGNDMEEWLVVIDFSELERNIFSEDILKYESMLHERVLRHRMGVITTAKNFVTDIGRILTGRS